MNPADTSPPSRPSEGLEIGTRFGVYEVLEPIGTGGMGEVYRARDTRLERDVALKLLPTAYAERQGWLARFEREARLLGSLSHPRIAILHGLEETEGGRRFLVMELVRGETLAQRIDRGPLSVTAALPIFGQVADALEAAHEQGIIHRDLKPDNIKITPEENVKILDFGLAKSFESSDDDAIESGSEALTMTRGGTIPGLILGTAAYMSPEQARGEPLDRRTDIWSFGCSFYEALTSRRVFEGETISDTMAAALTKEVDWSLLPAGTPPAIRRLLRRCLERDRDRRLHDIADARIEIEECMLDPAEPAEHSPARRRASRALALVAIASLAIGAGLGALAATRIRDTSDRARVTKRLTIPLDENDTVATEAFGGGRPALALSNDGRLLAYAVRSGTDTALMLRALDERDARAIAESDGASSPFFSPDGEWLGFSTREGLKRVSPTGEVTVEIQGVRAEYGASWTSGGGLVFSPGAFSGLSYLPSEAADARALTSLDGSPSDRGHRWPQVLPGDEHVLFTSWSGSTADEARIEAVALESGERRVIIEGGSFGRYSPSGHLLYSRDEALFAVVFDPDSLEVQGAAVPVLEGLRTSPTTGAAQLALAHDGTLVYVPAGRESSGALVWVDEGGERAPLNLPERPYETPRISPEGERLAASMVDDSGQNIWVYDMERRTFAALTSEASNSAPVWSPDGGALVFASDRAGVTNLFRVGSAGNEAVERLTESEHPQTPTSWSAGRAALVYQEDHPERGLDIWLLPMDDPSAEPEPLVQSEFDEHMGALSPDGAWLAFVSDASGGVEVYLRDMDDPASSWQVSVNGGVEPAWSDEGDELYFRSGERMMRTGIEAGTELEISAPEPLFDVDKAPRPSTVRTYDVASGRFLMTSSDWRREASEMRILLNGFGWLPEPE